MNDLQIACFVAVAQTGRFSAAAGKLYLSKPTVSYQIRALETELGTPLFSRTAGATELTDAGRVLLPLAQRLLRDFAAAKKAMARVTGGDGVHLVVPPGVFLLDTQMVRRIASEAEQQTGATVLCEPVPLSPEDSVQDLLEGRIDLLIIARHSAQKHGAQLEMTPLFESGQYAILPAAHPLAQREEIAPEDLAGETLLMSDEDNCFLPEIRACFQRRGVEAVWQQMTSYKVLMPFVEMGKGVTFMPRRVADMRGVVFRPFRLDRPQQIVLCSLKKQTDVRLQQVARIVRCAVLAVYGDRKTAQ